MTDSEIIQFLKNNQYTKAVKHLYSYYKDIKGYVIKNSGSREDAEDIFQEALFVVYNKINNDELVLTSSLKYYLFGVSRNLWRQELRNRKIDVTLLEDENEKAELFNIEDNYNNAERAFGLLGEKCKQLLIRFYIKKESLKTIAQALEFKTENVAKNQKFRCLEKAKENYIELLTA